MLCLPACRHGDSYSGDTFGPWLAPGSGGESAIGFGTDPDTMEKENAHMRVRAYADRHAHEMVHKWEDEMYFYADPPRLSMVGRRGHKGWTFSSPHGQSVKLDSDTKGKTGQTLAEWAPARAVYIVVRIAPLESKDEIELLGDDKLIQMDEEVIIAGEQQQQDDPQGDDRRDAQRPPRSTQTQTATEDSTPAPARGYVSTRNSTTGSERGMTGAENETHQGMGLKKQPGSEKGRSFKGSPKGHRHGRTREQGGVKPDGSITGVKRGAAHGGPGGSGKRSDNGVASGGGIEIFGLVIGGIINVPASLKPAVDVATILGQNLSAGGLFKKFAKLARIKKVANLRTELASTMRADIDNELRASFAKIDADKTLTATEKRRLKRRTKHLAGRQYFDMVEQGAASEVRRLTRELKKLKGKKGDVAAYNRGLLEEQLEAARKLEKAAKVKPIGGRLLRSHAYAGGQMPLPKSLHAKYGTHLRFTEDGFSDFSRFAKHKVKIKMQGDRRLDFKSANAAAGIDPPDSRRWVWHHHQDGEHMLLVPADLHRAVGHNGSFSLYKAERGL